MAPDQRISDVLAAKSKFGFSGIPITETGEMGGKLVGLITQRDVDFLGKDQHSSLISEVCVYRGSVGEGINLSFMSEYSPFVSFVKVYSPFVNVVSLIHNINIAIQCLKCSIASEV